MSMQLRTQICSPSALAWLALRLMSAQPIFIVREHNKLVKLTSLWTDRDASEQVQEVRWAPLAREREGLECHVSKSSMQGARW